MGITTRRQSRRVPQLPAELWDMVVQHAGHEVYQSVRSLSRHLHQAIHFYMPEPTLFVFLMSETISGSRQLVQCTLEWKSRGYWKLSCLLPSATFTCRLPPIFWEKRRRRFYLLHCMDAETAASTVLVHPCRSGADVQISLDFCRWSLQLSPLNRAIHRLLR